MKRRGGRGGGTGTGRERGKEVQKRAKGARKYCRSARDGCLSRSGPEPRKREGRNDLGRRSDSLEIGGMVLCTLYLLYVERGTCYVLRLYHDTRPLQQPCPCGGTKYALAGFTRGTAAIRGLLPPMGTLSCRHRLSPAPPSFPLKRGRVS